mmetsp:Transcript_7628/g.17562  ORF Transcript_7628/g.17562 Transcript_7628/m.17562 type:complete len:206 (-) Transcript_7628:923-1540(-)
MGCATVLCPHGRRRFLLLCSPPRNQGRGTVRASVLRQHCFWRDAPGTDAGSHCGHCRLALDRPRRGRKETQSHHRCTDRAGGLARPCSQPQRNVFRFLGQRRQAARGSLREHERCQCRRTAPGLPCQRDADTVSHQRRRNAPWNVWDAQVRRGGESQGWGDGGQLLGYPQGRGGVFWQGGTRAARACNALQTTERTTRRCCWREC